jgi:hypothetical protein
MLGIHVIRPGYVVLHISIDQYVALWMVLDIQWLHNNWSHGGAEILAELETDLTCTGCWASSGYSVQGCAQLEQKLRQCMDAPVCLKLSGRNNHISDLHSATQTRRRTTSTTTSRGCIRRSKDPTSGIKEGAPTKRALYITCIPSRVSTCSRYYKRIRGVLLSQHWDGVLDRLIASVYIHFIKSRNVSLLERSPGCRHLQFLSIFSNPQSNKANIMAS